MQTTMEFSSVMDRETETLSGKVVPKDVVIPKPKIVLVSGKAEAGKSQCADYMQEFFTTRGFSVLRINYAWVLKAICRDWFDWNGVKDEKGRDLLQSTGQFIRDKDPHFFIHSIFDVLDFFPTKWDFVIIDDLRYENELNLPVALGWDVTHVRVHRPGYENSLTEEQRQHSSEIGLDYSIRDFDITARDLVELQVEAEVVSQEIYSHSIETEVSR